MTATNDPLASPAFKAPGFLEKLCESFLGGSRPWDCAQIEVTSCCGGDCVYCPRSAQADAWKARHMRASTFAALWPLLRKSKRAHLQGWGEPLLHPRFLDFQKLAAKAGCATSTTSSGMGMDAQKAAAMAVSGMDLVAFSLAGTDAASNDARRRVPFTQVCDAIRMLRAAIKEAGTALEIHLAYLMLADRTDAAARLPELLDELDADMAVVSTLDYLAAPQQRHLAFAPDEKDKIARARDILCEARQRAEVMGRLIHFALPSKMPALAGCRENIGKSLYVDADGQVSPCVYLNVPGADGPDKRRVFGNVNEQEPLSIWQGEEYAAFRRRLLDGQPDAVCAACPKRMEREDLTG